MAPNFGFTIATGGRVRRRALGALAIGALLAASLGLATVEGRAQVGGHAQRDRTSTACIDWSAESPTSCPDAAWVSSTVEGIVGHRVFSTGACNVTVRGRIRQAGRGYSATIALIDREGRPLGERKLEQREGACRSLGGPASLVIALMVEEQHPDTVLEVTPELTSPEPPHTAPLASTPEGPALRAAAGAVATWNLLPGFAMGQTIDVGMTFTGFVPVNLGLTLLDGSSSERGGLGGRFWGWHTGLALCPRLFASTRAEIALCGGAQAGAIHGTGIGLEAPQSVACPVLLAEGKAVGSLFVSGRLGIYAQIGLLVPVVNARFVYLDGTGRHERVFEPDPVLAVAALGLEIRAGESPRTRSP